MLALGVIYWEGTAPSLIYPRREEKSVLRAEVVVVVDDPDEDRGRD